MAEPAKAGLSPAQKEALPFLFDKASRPKYCAAQLKNAEKYNPHHTNVHGFVGAYTVTTP